MMKILIVDDERPIMEWLEYTIRALGMDCQIVGACTNGADAASLYRSHHPDVVITDIKMPIMDGISFLREISPITNCYVVVLSNYDTFSYARETLTLGASEFILKTEIDSGSLHKLLTRAQAQVNLRKLKHIDMRHIPSVSGFLSDLKDGIDVELRNIEDFLLENNISPLASGVFFTISYRAIGVNPASLTGVLSFLIEDPGIVNPYLFSLDKERHILLACQADHDFERFAARFQAFIQVPIGVSNLLSGPENLGKSIRQSQTALDCTFFTDAPIVYFHNRMLFGAHNLEPYYDAIVKWISEGDWQGAIEATDQAFDYIHDHSDEYTRKYVLSFVQSIACAIIMARSNDLKNYQAITQQMNSMAAVILKLERLRDAQKYVLSLLQETSHQQDVQTYSYHIARAVRYVRQNFTKPITLQDLTAYSDLSPEYFCRLFKKETGKTFTQYLNLIRIQYAMSLLRSTDRAVNAISEQCGFHNINYFNAQFKRIVGVQPTLYRKRHLQSLCQLSGHQEAPT